MIGLVLFMVFQVPQEYVVRMDATRTYQTAHEDIYQRINMFSGDDIQIYVEDIERAKIFRTRAEAEFHAEKLRHLMKMKGWSAAVWTMRKEDYDYNTNFYESRIYIGENIF